MTLVSGVDSKDDAATSSALLPPMVPNLVVKIGSKYIASAKKCRKWKWAPFQSSARQHDQHEFRHWVRAGVEYPDYPYARFDIHLERVQFTNEEYRKYLTDPTWTKSDTDQLMEMARIYELRWAVVYDRWCELMNDDGKTPSSSQRKLEDLQHRFYTVAATLAQVRITKEAAAEVSALSSVPNADTSELQILETAAARALATSGSGNNNSTTTNATTGDQAAIQNPPILLQHVGTGTSSNKQVFHLQHERERRRYLDMIWNRTKAEEEEELELRKELKLIDVQLRKLKKSGGHIAAGGAGTNSRAATPVPVTAEQTAALLDKAFGSTAPIPMPETPYLQSGRLAGPATGGQLGINKTLLKRMDTILIEECKLPAKPIVATKRFCDLYDSVRKDTLTLLTLQKVVLQKEGQLQTKRLRLAKVSGRAVMEEEALLGIAPTPAPAPAPAARANKKQQKRASGAGSKGGGGGKGAAASNSAASKAAAAAAAKGGDEKATTKKAATKKRKSKADATKAAAAAAAAAAIGVGTLPAPVGPVAPPLSAASVAAGKMAATAAAAAAVAAATAAAAAVGDSDKTPAKKRARKT